VDPVLRNPVGGKLSIDIRENGFGEIVSAKINIEHLDVTLLIPFSIVATLR